MRKLLWLAAWSLVAVWSLLAFAAYGLIDFVGGLIARNADRLSSDPQTVEAAWRVFDFLHTASTSAALIVWGCVSLLILSVPWLLDRLAGRASVTVYRSGPGAAGAPRPGWRPAPEGVIDLAPDQYSERPRSDRPAGSVPSIAPRR